MTAALPRWRWEQEFRARNRGLPEGVRLTLWHLSTYANHKDSKGIRPGNPRMAEELGVSPAAIQRRMRQARESGWVLRDGPIPKGRGHAQSYRLAIPSRRERVSPSDSVSALSPEETVSPSDSLSAAKGVTETQERVSPSDPLPTHHQSNLSNGGSAPSAPAIPSEAEILSLIARAPSFDDDLRGEVLAVPKPDTYSRTSDPLLPPPRKSTLPEWKQRELYERQMAEEGLDSNGELPEERSRNRYIRRSE